MYTFGSPEDGGRFNNVQGFEGWPLGRVRQPPQDIESGMDVGAPVHGRGSGSNPEAPKDMSETGRNDS